MDKATYRRVFTQFLNNYWGAFHEVLEAQSVNPQVLAAPLFEALVAQHERFTAPSDGAVGPALEGLGRLWRHVAERRKVTIEAPLSAREVAHAREQFERIYDALAARGAAYPNVRAEVLSHVLHGHPRAPLRADPAR